MPLADYQADMERCSQCTYCEWIPFDQVKSWRFGKGCPSIAYNNFLSYSARGRLAVAWSLLKGKSNYTDRLVDIVYKCQTCGSCDVSCKVCRYNMEPLETWFELRAKLVEDGQCLTQHKSIIESLRKEYNMMQELNGERGEWASELDVKCLPEERAEVVFYAGCRFSYDKDLQSVARTVVTLLKDAVVDIGIMGNEEGCCGGRAFQMGYTKEFLECARRNIEVWEKCGVKKIVTSCSDCYHAFKRLYPGRMNSRIEVLHTVEFIARLVREGKLKFSKKVPMSITYHDPCHLGRQGESYVPWNGNEKKIRNQIVVYEPRKPRYNGAWGIYDPPREVIRSIPGIELVEMERIREYSWCCGAGGGVREAYPDFSNWTAKERIEEAKVTGAEAIVTACPWCERNFIDAINATGDNMKVIDIAELVRRAM